MKIPLSWGDGGQYEEPLTDRASALGKCSEQIPVQPLLLSRNQITCSAREQLPERET